MENVHSFLHARAAHNISSSPVTVEFERVLLPLNFYTILCAAAVAAVVRFVSVAIYRLYFHPLSKLPGSPWAAVSTWYDVYWNIWHSGQLIFEIKRLHDVHGPIVRIGPNEVHVSNPDVHYQMFKPGTKFLKDRHHYDAYCLPKSLPGMVERKDVRSRREAYRPIFGRTSIRNRWPELCTKINVLISQLTTLEGPIAIQDAFSSFALDVISEMTFSKDFEATNVPGFKHPFISEAQEAAGILWYLMLFPRLRRFAIAVEPYCTALYKKLQTTKKTATLKLIDSVQNVITDYMKNRNEKDFTTSHVNLIDHFMNPKATRDWVVPDLETLSQESVAILGGATETTAVTNTFAMYEITKNPEIKRRLQQELDSHIPQRDTCPTWEEMENMPYLSAVVKESLRVANPFPGRAPRIVPKGGIEVNGVTLPEGTVISMSAYIMHRQEEIFTDANTFNPDRWLQNDTAVLDRSFITFSKGVGECPGKMLAYAEVYSVIANVFRRFDVQLAPGMSDENMKWKDSITVRFANDKLKLHFKLRDN